MAEGFLKIVVLKHLSEEPMTGYSLMNAIKDCSGKKPSSGSIYPILAELNEEGSITCKEEGRKKTYTITAKGKKSVQKLFSEKQKFVLQNIKQLKEFGAVAGQDTVKPLITFFELLHTRPDVVMRTLHLVQETQETMLRLAQSNDFKKKESRIKTILEKRLKELKKLEKE